eukprot:TRINITY_DN26440_c0_g1_i1.p1 TRINITY_DN26440_c0_g1~~TRINITY_DN26440_c0_g1_i1.p1  ORF type:complete len:129 (+),score=41.54 TRINITY_DN26440_c0_g1_i1:223-609(+)
MNPVIPKALRAVKSASLLEAQQRSIRLYRQMLRSVPQIMSDYKMTNVPFADVRDRLKTEFLANAKANGESVEKIDRSIFRGAQELEETLMNWKTPTHVYRYVEVEKVAHRDAGSGFLKDFYANTLSPY